MPRHNAKVDPRWVVAVDDCLPNSRYQTYTCEDFEQVYAIVVNLLARYPDVIIDVFLDHISPDTYRLFCYRNADKVYMDGRGPDGERFDAEVSLANQESSVTEES